LKRLLTLPLVAVDERVADLAASIRVDYGFKTPGAFPLAAAMATGANVFYTNDKHLRQYPDVDVVLVDQ